MSDTTHASLYNRVYLLIESYFMEKLVPKDHVGPVLKFLFRLPLFYQRIGLGFVIPRNVLIVTTRGRRSGRLHQTPVEFGPGLRGPDVPLVMSGWDGHTDWYRNALADPCVRVWMRGREWEARAERASDQDVAELLKRLAKVQPAANRMWSRWAGFEIDGSEASYLAAAPHFPSLYLVPAASSGS